MREYDKHIHCSRLWDFVLCETCAQSTVCELNRKLRNTAKEPKEPQDDKLKQMEDLIYRLMGTLEMFTDDLDALVDYKSNVIYARHVLMNAENFMKERN